MTILNFHTNTVLDNTGRWTVNLPCNINAKMAVVRQICFVSTNAQLAIWSIRSTLSHDVLGSVHNEAGGFVSNPQTIIKLNNPNVGYIEFSLTSMMLPVTALATDQISIQIDFFGEEDLKFTT